MVARLTLSTWMVLCATSALPAQTNLPKQTNPLELVPDSAVAAVVLRWPAELGRRGDQVLRDAKIESSFAPGQIVNLLQLGLGLIGVQPHPRTGGSDPCR